jgi:Domain of unknown function (DUF4747)/pfkB family carbohydrate kinase
VVASQDGVIAVPAFPIEKMVDTTGAGDLFAAGFLFGLVRGAGHEAAGRLGALAAAEVTDEEMQPVVDALPPNLEPNFRPFMYILNQAEHLVLVEIRNESGQRFAPSRAERMFERLFEGLPADLPEVDITVIPEEETLEKIFAIKRLRKLEIFILRPNPDDLGEDYKRIMGLLEQEGARSQRIEKIKAAKKPTLTPSEETRRLAIIGSTNGYVSGEGKDESGTTVFESTKDHPKIRKLVVNTSTFATILSALRLYLRQAVGKPGSRD